MTTLRWGLVGAGDIVRKRVAAALRETKASELVAVSRRDAALAESTRAEFGCPQFFSDWRDLVRSSDIDAIYIATPVYLHAEQTIAAANAGKHVLCEKPMALNTDECDLMLEACRANGVRLGIAYYRHFYPVIPRAKEIIATGEIGRVSIAQINAFEHFNPSPDDPRYWFVERDRSGGGPMMDFGCHRVEVMLNLFGKVKRVESIVSSDVYVREVEDTATAMMHFDNGVIGSVNVTHAANAPQDTLDIYGTEGSIRIPALNTGEMTISSSSGERTEVHPPSTNFHEPLISDFVDAVLAGQKPAVDGDIGRRVASVIDQIYGRPAR
jgi:predicted dehydrogenase